VAHSRRFSLSLRILAVLGTAPNAMHTSAAIAKKLSESAAVVRRHFRLLEKSGFIEKRRGYKGGARLKAASHEIGVGDVYLAVEANWLASNDPTISRLLKRAREEVVVVMNETTLAQILKYMKRGPISPSKGEPTSSKVPTKRVAGLSKSRRPSGLV